MSIWTIKEYERKDKIPSLGGSYLGPFLWRQLNRQDVVPFTWRKLFGSLPMKVVKTIGSLYVGGNWPAESLQFRGTWVPLWVSTIWRQLRVELTLRSSYPRAIKIKDTTNTPGTAICNALVCQLKKVKKVWVYLHDFIMSNYISIRHVLVIIIMKVHSHQEVNCIQSCILFNCSLFYYDLCTLFNYPSCCYVDV